MYSEHQDLKIKIIHLKLIYIIIIQMNKVIFFYKKNNNNLNYNLIILLFCILQHTFIL